MRGVLDMGEALAQFLCRLGRRDGLWVGVDHSLCWYSVVVVVGLSVSSTSFPNGNLSFVLPAWRIALWVAMRQKYSNRPMLCMYSEVAFLVSKCDVASGTAYSDRQGVVSVGRAMTRGHGSKKRYAGTV